MSSDLEASSRFKLNKKLKLSTEKLDFRKGSKRTKVNSKSNPEVEGKFNYLNTDSLKKKRVYASRGMDIQVNASSLKFVSKERRRTAKEGPFKENINKNSSRTMWSPSRIRNASSENKRMLGKFKNAHEGSQISAKRMRMKSKEVDGDDVGRIHNSANEAKQFPRKSKNAFEGGQFSGKKMKTKVKEEDSVDGKAIKDIKALDHDSEVIDDRPRKIKFDIRIDPYDTSNKRLDDGLDINENKKEKVKEREKDEKMSMNAQFRAIKPSPSILSFVEENLLGRRREIELKRAGYNIDLSAPLDNIPFSTSSERERIEESIFRNKLSFFAAAKVSSSFPPPDLPEIAFAGRSNVGKSSLLNALTRQWGVVRTSDKPGHTQSINFFNLGSKLCMVDLPGYGFAYAKEEVKDAWEELVKEYVSTRVGLKRVCLLIDTQWGMKPRDHELIDLMERYQTRYQIVLTKTDKVFPIDVARRAMQIEESLKANRSAVQPVMLVSSKSGAGIRSLRTVLTKISRFAKC